MRVENHIKFSVIVSIALFLWWRSFFYASVAFIAGVAIDCDHFIDFYAYKPNTNPTGWIREFFDVCNNVKLNKLYLLLHSYELMALLWVAIFFFSLGKFWTAIAIGFTQHLIIDQLSNQVKPMIYFFSYRVANNFDKEKLVQDKSIIQAIMPNR